MRLAKDAEQFVAPLLASQPVSRESTAAVAVLPVCDATGQAREILAVGHRVVICAGDLPVTRRGASGCRKG